MGCQHSKPIPSASTFDIIHTQTEPYLGAGTNAVPRTDGIRTELVVKERAFRSWSGDSFTIRVPNGDSYADGIQIKGKALSLRDKMVLEDGNGSPIAICMRTLLKLVPTFRIYSFVPIIEGQSPSDEKHCDRPLYVWAECINQPLSVQYTLALWNGTNFARTFVSDKVGPVFGLQNVLVSKYDQPVCMMLQTRFEFCQGQVWKVTVAPGVDPCLMICFVAIIDEMMERRK
jgi:hypothetical protein